MTGLWLRPAFIVGLFLTSLLVAPFHNVQGETEELEGVPEELPEECRSYIKKVLKEHGTGSIEHTSLESEAAETRDNKLDDSQNVFLNEQDDGLSSKNKVDDIAKADPSTEQSVEVNVQQAEDKAPVHAEDVDNDAPISDKIATDDNEDGGSKGYGESASTQRGISIENLESTDSMQISKEGSLITEKIGMAKKLRYNKWTKVEELIDDGTKVVFEKDKTKTERSGRYGKWTKSEEEKEEEEEVDISVKPNVSVEKESKEGQISEDIVSTESVEKLSKESKVNVEKTTKESKEKKPVKKGKYGKWTKWEELENESEEHAVEPKNEEQTAVKAGKRGKYGKWTKWEDLEAKSEQVVTPKEAVIAHSGEKKELDTGKEAQKGKYGKWTKWDDFEGQSEEALSSAASAMKPVTKKEEPVRTGRYGKWTKFEDLEGESEEIQPEDRHTNKLTTKTEKSDRSGRYGKWTKWEDFENEEDASASAEQIEDMRKSFSSDESVRKGRYGKWTKWEDFENEEEAMAQIVQDKKATVDKITSIEPKRRGRYGKWTKWEDFENEEDAYTPAANEEKATIITGASVETSHTGEPERRGRYGKWTKWEDFENEEEAYTTVYSQKEVTVAAKTSQTGVPERRGRYGKWTKWEDFENIEEAYTPAFSDKEPTIIASVSVKTSQTDEPERRGRYGKWTKWEDFDNKEDAYAAAFSEKKPTITASESVKTSHTDEPERRGRYGKWTKWEDFDNKEDAYAPAESIEKKIAVKASVPVETSKTGDPARRARYGKWTKFEEFENEDEAYLSAGEVHHTTFPSDESVRKGRYGKWTKWEDFDGDSEESLMTSESPLMKVVEKHEPIDRKLQPYGKWTVVEELKDLEKIKTDKEEDIKVKKDKEPVRKGKYGKWTKLEASEEIKERDDVGKTEPTQIEKEVTEKKKDVSSVEKAETSDSPMPPKSEEMIVSFEESETSKSAEYTTFETPKETDTEEVESIETLEIESEEKVISVERQKSAERSAEGQKSVEISAEGKAKRSVERYVEDDKSAEKSADLEKRVEKSRSDQVTVSTVKDDKLYESVKSAELARDDESQRKIKFVSEETLRSAEKSAEKIIEVVAKEAEPIPKPIVEKKGPYVLEIETKEVEEKKVKKRAEEISAETKEYKDGQETPEEELIRGVELPKNLRSRDHINKLLKLDEENEDKERALENVANVILKDLKKLYDEAIKPLETLYKYRDLSNRHFGDPEIFSKPLVLFMGPWSGGKSSIINYLLNIEYNDNALRTGAEPSPAYFNILMHGDHTEVLDGTQLAADWTFSGLQKFGQGMLDRLRGLKLRSKLLEKVNIVEIPGILEIRKQVQRLFPFNDACQWFIDRADIIFLVYDPSKLDVGPETEAILDQLKGREYQSRIILNKADQVKPEELMRVQGTLIWNISPLMSSVEPPIMYSTSLWSMPYEAGAPIRLLQAQERALLRDLRSAITKKVEHKIASARRFAVRVRNHAKMVDCYLTTYYNHKSFFGNKKDVSDKIIENPQNYHIYEGLSTLTNISRYDLPDPDVYRDFFRLNTLYDFPLLSTTCTYFRGCPINRLDVAIAYDLPELVGQYKKLAETTLRKYDPNYSAS